MLARRHEISQYGSMDLSRAGELAESSIINNASSFSIFDTCCSGGGSGYCTLLDKRRGLATRFDHRTPPFRFRLPRPTDDPSFVSVSQ